MTSERLVVFDLDGTLISVNSFRLWLERLPRLALRHPTLIVPLLRAVTQRALGQTDRVAMKRAVIQASTRLPPRVHAAFAQDLHRLIRPALAPDLRRYLDDPSFRVYLSTAAPEYYVLPLARLLDIQHVSATRNDTGSGWTENFGEHKVSALEQLEGLPLPELHTVYSDDHHDLPLMHLARKVVLVNPTQVSVDRIRANGITISTILGEVRR